MCRPATGIVQAKPVTPQPPSSSALCWNVGGMPSYSRSRDATILRIRVSNDVGAHSPPSR